MFDLRSETLGIARRRGKLWGNEGRAASGRGQRKARRSQWRRWPELSWPEVVVVGGQRGRVHEGGGFKFA
jgi:hypothetical protein